MADYIYLLETRLSPAQQAAIGTVRNIARENELTIFLTGGAVRDLTGGGSIRDLDLTVQGDALKLKKALEKSGADIVGENAPAQQLFLLFPGGVRMELSSAMCVTYPKPGKPKFETGSLTDDLRRRDFTANAMAISLNDGSYGLLMDPLNGVADIENRELRLVSNYGFIEDPSRLIRAARLSSRLGWQLEERTRQRYETAKEENYIAALGSWHRGYELEEIFHEDDPTRVLRALEAEGWMPALFPGLNSAKANTAALAEVGDRLGHLQMANILATSAALTFPLVTAKMPAPDVARLKGMFVRPGFVREIESLESRTKDFAAHFSGKEAATPSAAWKLLYATEPNLVLSLLYSSKAAGVQARLKTFLTDSPGARQRIPYTLMQEMRITSDLPGYADLVEKLFFELMDGRLSEPEEMKAFLEPYSPPAPPPPVNLRRARAKKEARPSRAKAKKASAEESALPTVAAQEEMIGVAEGLMEPGTLTGPDRGPEPSPKVPLEGKVAPEAAEKPGARKAAAAKEPAAKAPAAAKKTVSTAPAKVALKEAATKPTGKQANKALAKAGVKAAGKPAKTPVVKASKSAGKPAPVKAAVKKASPIKAAAKKPAPQVKSRKPALKKAAPAKKVAAAKNAAAAKKAAPARKVASVKAKAANKATAAHKGAATKQPAKKSPAGKSATSGRRR